MIIGRSPFSEITRSVVELGHGEDKIGRSPFSEITRSVVELRHGEDYNSK